MLVTPLPGVNRDDVLKTLREIESAAGDVGNTSGTANDRLLAYLKWATDSARMLGSRLRPADIDRLVLTRGYERLLTAAGNLTSDVPAVQKVLNGMITEELRQRTRAFEDAVLALSDQIARWPANAVYTVPDTSVYIEHESKLEDIDFHSLVPFHWPDHMVRVIVPVIILDELDSLKRSGDARRRWRAGYTLAVMDKAFSDKQFPGLLRKATRHPERGAVVLDLLFDPPGHGRLPINDDEIIDRAGAAQGLAGSGVTLLTFDTSQAARARYASLKVNKLAIPLGDEPADTRSRKAKPPVDWDASAVPGPQDTGQGS
jgi:hypothetical protein